MTGEISLTTQGSVAWADTDASGWIHFTAAFRWVEEAEHRIYRALGVDPGRFPRRSVEAEYSTPLTAGTPFTVELTLERFGSTSLTWSWAVWPAAEDGEARITKKPAITGRFTAVHMGAQGRPEKLPAQLAELRETGAARQETNHVPV